MIMNKSKCYKFVFILLSLGFTVLSFSNSTSYDSLLVRYKNTKNDSLRIQTLSNIVDYWKSNNEDSVFHYSKILINESITVNNNLLLFESYLNVINYYWDKGVYDSALYNAFKGMKYFPVETELSRHTEFLHIIGELYRAMQQLENSSRYLNEAWEMIKESEYYSIKGGISNRLAAVYFEMKDYQHAMQWADTSIRISKKLNIPAYVISNLNIKGAINRDIGRYQLALENFREALLRIDSIKGYFDKSLVLNNIATTFFKMGDFNNAIKYAEESYNNSVEQDDKALIVVSSELLAKSYAKIEQYKKAYEYLRIYEVTRHNLFFEKRDKQISELSAKYETEVKEHLIELQNITLAKKDLKIRNNRIIIFSFVFVLILLISFLIYRYRLHRKMKLINERLEFKKNKIIEQKENIENYSQKIQKAYQKLQEVNEYKDAMTNMIVHDLRNPLNLLANIEMYENADEKERIVNNTSKLMLNMVQNLLEISKAENNSMALAKTEISIDKLIEIASNDVAFLCNEKNIRIVNQSDNNYLFSADLEIMRRVFINLFSNAIKFSPINEIVEIFTSVTPDQKLKISVKDNGQGIPAKYHKEIFKKFNKVNRTESGNYSSTGLGLAFCKMAVESHGWKIGVKSEIGSGSEFWILIDEFSVLKKTNISLDNNKNLENIDNVYLPDEDRTKLKPLLENLLKLNIYAVTEIKQTLIEIEKMNIRNMDQWIDKIRMAVKNLDKKRFNHLIKSLLK